MIDVKKLVDIVAKESKISPDELTENTAFEHLEKWDSMNYVNLILEVEHGFGISLPLEKLSELQTIKQLMEFINLELEVL